MTLSLMPAIALPPPLPFLFSDAARAAAHVVPDKIRCVVTFGSAASGPNRTSYVRPLFESITRSRRT